MAAPAIPITAVSENDSAPSNGETVPEVPTQVFNKCINSGNTQTAIHNGDIYQGTTHYNGNVTTINSATGPLNVNYITNTHVSSNPEVSVYEVVAWLEGASFTNIYKTALDSRMEGTGTWFLQRAEFQALMTDTSVILWATGLPGSGKTVISALSIKTLQNAFSSQSDVAVVYAFIRYSEKNSARDILASLLSQLLLISGTAGLADLPRAYERCKATKESLTAREVAIHLQDAIRHFRKVFIAIDGLDEASDSVKEVLLEELLRLSGVNILITSRLLDTFSSYTPDCLRVSIQALTDDIGLFVRSRITKSRRLKMLLGRYPDLIEEICTRVKQQSSGMFLVAKLQVDVLEAHPNSVTGLKKALEALPSGLDAMYEQTFTRILEASEDDASIAKRALIWMAYRRDWERDGISVDDFQKAVSTSHEKGFYNPDDLVPMEIILGACCGLVEVLENKVSNWGSDVYEARLVHYSTLEFILRNTGFLGIQSPHAMIAVTCLIHVSQHMEYLQNFLTRDWSNHSNSYCSIRGVHMQWGYIFNRYVLDPIPLLRYAYHHWENHACQSYYDGFGLDPFVATFLKGVTRYPSFSVTPGTHLSPLPSFLNGLDLAAMYGFPDVIATGHLPFLTETNHKHTPFHIAATYGQVDAMFALLEAGYKGLNATDADCNTPLHYAVQNQYESDLVQHLLFPHPSCSSRVLAELNSLQINARSGEGLTPLHYAVGNHSDFSPRNIRLLLQRQDIECNAQDHWGHTPLHRAAQWGTVDTINAVLSSSSVDSNAQVPEINTTPLMCAIIHNRDPRAANCILHHRGKRDLNVSLRDRGDWSALEHSFARALIWHGSDPSTQKELLRHISLIDLILTNGKWDPDALFRAATIPLESPSRQYFRKGRIAPILIYVWSRLMMHRECSRVGDCLAALIVRASEIRCRSCVPAVLTCLRGPPMSFLRECTCTFCLIVL